jgi:hypothetical protein
LLEAIESLFRSGVLAVDRDPDLVTQVGVIGGMLYKY